MAEFALLINGVFTEIRRYDAKPPNIVHKGIAWYPVVREYGEPFEGIVGFDWVIRTVDPATLPPPVPQEITFAQLLIGLVASGWITEAEGNAWLSGVLPTVALGVINTLPENQRFAARARALRPSSVVRSDPLVIALAQAQGITSAQLDQFFITFSQV